MFIKDFPGCCTAKVLCNLGGSSTSQWDADEVTVKRLHERFEELLQEHDFRTEFDQDEWDEEELEDGAGCGLIVATTTTEQEQANDFLQSAGFLRVGPYIKEAHPETGLYLWWYVTRGVFGKLG